MTPNIVKIPVKQLTENKGQIAGVPTNPRQWTKADVERLAKSLADTPELFEMRPCLVYEQGGKYVVIGGNMRLAAAKHNHETEVPCIVIPADTTPDKLRELVLKDNGSFGAWDFDALANEWDDLPLVEWGVDLPFVAASEDKDASEEMEEKEVRPFRYSNVLLVYPPEVHEQVAEALKKLVQIPDIEIYMQANG